MDVEGICPRGGRGRTCCNCFSGCTLDRRKIAAQSESCLSRRTVWRTLQHKRLRLESQMLLKGRLVTSLPLHQPEIYSYRWLMIRTKAQDIYRMLSLAAPTVSQPKGSTHHPTSSFLLFEHLALTDEVLFYLLLAGLQAIHLVPERFRILFH